MARFLPKRPIAILLAAYIALDVVVMFFFRDNIRSRDREIVVVGLAFGEAVLVAAWAALGNLPIVFRLPMAVLATGLLIRFIWIGDNLQGTEINKVMIDVGSLTALAAGALGVARGCGIRLTLVSASDALGERKARQLQFSLSQLLQIVACWSLVLATLRWVFPPLNPISHDDLDWMKKDLLIFVPFFCIPVPIGIWAFLNGKGIAVRGFIFGTLLLVLGYLFEHFLEGPPGEDIYIYFLYSAVFIAALLIARFSGYRVSRTRRVRPAPPTGN